MSSFMDAHHDSEELRIITPIGMLGYGYDAAEFLEFCETRRPHAIISDAGSTDSGPQKLALGLTTCPREAYVRDFGPLLLASSRYHIPVIISSCGGSGTNAQVDLFADIVRELAEIHGYRFRVAKIYAEFDKEIVLKKLESGKIGPCGPVPPLTPADVEETTVIVGQMGAEPFIEALSSGEPVDIILGGRAYDPAPYAALCLMKGIDPGVAWHMGKILECGGLCAEPKQPIIFSTIRKDSFDVEPTNPMSRCTTVSVAAHTLYEKTRPDLLPGPGGVLNLSATKYEQLNPRCVRVRGPVFEPRPYQVKLEGAKLTGFRSIFIGGIRDPVLISQIDDVLKLVEGYARNMNKDFQGNNCRIAFHIYGQNGVMGPLEPNKTPAHELCILGEVLAPTEKLAKSVCNTARVALLHAPYPYQVATGGNMASPLTPLENEIGKMSEFSIYHLMDLDDPLSSFPISYEDIETQGKTSSYPLYTHRTSGGSETLLPIQSKMVKVDPVALWQSALEKEHKTIRLRDLASVLRSKNSGPYELTFDVMFPNEEIFAAVRASGVLTKERLAQIYNVEVSSVLACLFFAQARAFKFTIPRTQSNGAFGETDMHGCQQHIPLGDIEIPLQ